MATRAELRAELNQKVQEGLIQANLGARRTGEWLRRRSVDSFNGLSGLGIIVLGFFALDPLLTNPHVIQSLRDIGHMLSVLPSEGIQVIPTVSQEAISSARVGIEGFLTSADAPIRSGLLGATDVVAASLRHTVINGPERDRRRGPVIPITQLIPK